MRNLSILFSFMLLPGVSHEDALLVRHSSFFSSPGGFKSSFVDHILSSFQCFLMPVQFLIIHFSLFNCSGVLKISRRFVFSTLHSFKLFRGLILFKPFIPTGAISPSNHSTVFVSSISKLYLFSHPPTPFLQGLKFLNQVSFYS